MYNLKAIQIFVVVAETCSFRKAAEILHRSQSAVSTQIKLLEEQIGVALFHRTTRRVQLTAEGEQLLGHAQRAVASLEIGLRQIKETANIQFGNISMGCVPSIAATVLPPVLAEFQRKRSGIHLELRELASAQLLETISKQEILFGIGPEVEQASDFDFMPITKEPIYALLPKAHWKIGQNNITLAELVPLPVILASSSAALRNTLNRELAMRGLEIKHSFEVLQVQTMLAFAQAGLGVAILPQIMIPQPLDETLQALPIVDPVLERKLCLITLKGNSLSPAARELTSLIVNRFRGIIGSSN
ncbi:LysR family transcriptional regulator [Novosphingobium sp.]|uniref:LysR family transcriptional regulator n=1 Tax=Novosphingobium sp. TaxID=1874826 RepID=UPI00261A461B|nr:LysR family transcriptional regulator [Novosphingobium sp.]